MSSGTIYTRVYSKRNAAQLISAKGPQGTLSHPQLLHEFRNHANKWNQEATALVSVSRRIIDTVNRAVHKHFIDDEPPEDIWIVFIKPKVTENESPPRIHAASDLAEQCGLSEPNKFLYEMVFEWSIPDTFVMHQVSLQTLMSRGLLRDYPFGNGLYTTAELRCLIAEDFRQSDAVNLGLYLGFFAQKFGARAPIRWLPEQLFRDCMRMTDEVDFDCWITQHTIDEVLTDWWLIHCDFISDYEEFEDWKEIMKDCINEGVIEFGEEWDDAEEDDLEMIIARDKLEARNRGIKAQIEEYANIGMQYRPNSGPVTGGYRDTTESDTADSSRSTHQTLLKNS
ncbi:unnamed protein product [Parascedosporium putredinis]|uniref:Uncharacterized protein n=1 Tax=Parascedosporium putredinis TaxID=1442378 RepID=A0A9P1GYA7_9PEZI|nr:unnamed protein product [Parascedosporium putredinis]CAI7989974.1 unnamed protein product [Parascedosporium putredinis]